MSSKESLRTETYPRSRQPMIGEDMNAIEFIRHYTLTDGKLRNATSTRFLIVAGLILCSCAYAQDGNTKRENKMNDYKQQATLWYEAFSKKDPAILDRILSEDWVDIPSSPG